MVIADNFYMVHKEEPFYIFRVKKVSRNYFGQNLYNITNVTTSYDCGDNFTVRDFHHFAFRKNSIYKITTEKEGLGLVLGGNCCG